MFVRHEHNSEKASSWTCSTTFYTLQNQPGSKYSGSLKFICDFICYLPRCTMRAGIVIYIKYHKDKETSPLLKILALTFHLFFCDINKTSPSAKNSRNYGFTNCHQRTANLEARHGISKHTLI